MKKPDKKTDKEPKDKGKKETQEKGIAKREDSRELAKRASSTNADEKIKKTMSELAMEDPARIADIIKLWMAEDEE